MAERFLIQLFEHNNWANRRILEACAALTDAQLDAEPQTATKGSIRETLTHLVTSQRGYHALLTLPLDSRPVDPLAYDDLATSMTRSGDGLLALARDEANADGAERLRTRDGYLVEPWVVMVQVINHATEHREQIKSMLTALGMTPPDVDGWTHGLSMGALVPSAP
ncbi:MAG: DinB family protein [Ardenticatenales bacterium]